MRDRVAECLVLDDFGGGDALAANDGFQPSTPIWSGNRCLRNGCPFRPDAAAALLHLHQAAFRPKTPIVGAKTDISSDVGTGGNFDESGVTNLS